MTRGRLFSSVEAAAYLKMSVAAFNSYVSRHRVTFVRIDHHRRFTQATLDAVRRARAKKDRS